MPIVASRKLYEKRRYLLVEVVPARGKRDFRKLLRVGPNWDMILEDIAFKKREYKELMKEIVEEPDTTIRPAGDARIILKYLMVGYRWSNALRIARNRRTRLIALVS